MQCAWDQYIRLLPSRFRGEVDKQGRASLLETRLRIGQPPQLIFKGYITTLHGIVSAEDLRQCVNYACQYSPWAAGTVRSGYITALGGHRVGIFGRYTKHNDDVCHLQTPFMLNLRVCRDFPGIANKIAVCTGSVLIIGPPGCGKTTLLRDYIRIRSNTEHCNISVIDEREEIFPRFADSLCFSSGQHTDILSGCSKIDGLTWALRNMTPSVIAVDEITAAEDCDALTHAAWCGVELVATAHAGSKKDLYNRPIYKPILDAGIFQNLIVMKSDKQWNLERIEL